MTSATRSLLSIAVCSLLTATAVARMELPKADEDAVTYMPDADPMMQKAFARARAGLDDFLKLARSPAANLEGFALKVGLKVDGKTEYVWIVDFAQDASGGFSGVINNDVEMTKKYKLGDKYRFKRTDIVDWTYIDRERLRCLATTRSAPC